MTPIVKLLLASFLWCGGAAAADLSMRVRPTLPPEIRTVQQAIAYYLEPAGYTFVAADPTYGDFHDLAARPVPRTAPDNQPVAIRDAILAVLPGSVVLYIDMDQQLIKLGRRPASARDARDRVHVIDAPASRAIPDMQPEESVPAVFVDVSPAAPARDPDSRNVEVDQQILERRVLPSIPSPDERPSVSDLIPLAPMLEPPAPPPPLLFSLTLVAGETLSAQLAKATPPGYQVVWRAPNDLLVGANATLTAATFEGAVVDALRALWHTRNALIVTHYSNDVLVITTP